MLVEIPPKQQHFLSSVQSPDALVIFCRTPRLGKVKTRLATTHGNEFALGLYRAMLRDTFASGKAVAPAVETWAYFTPATVQTGQQDDTFPPELACDWDGRYFPQSVGDLGAKMLTILQSLRTVYQNIVLIGSDSPDLPLNYLQEAFEKLNENDFVIGPSNDGGFYLLGVSRAFAPSLFDGISWSTEHVYSRLVSNVKALKPDWTIHTLPSWRDVDDANDVEALRERLALRQSEAHQTCLFLEANPR